MTATFDLVAVGARSLCLESRAVLLRWCALNAVGEWELDLGVDHLNH